MGASVFGDGEREQRRREAKRMSSISELERAVVEAAKACKSEPPPGAWRVLSDAVAALQAAEEAARKPRLRTAYQRAVGGCYTRASCFDPDERVASIAQVRSLIEARDAEWMAAIRKLACHQAFVTHYRELAPGIACGGGGHVPAILLSDIEALVAETK